MNFPWFHLSQHTDCVPSPVDPTAISAARDAIQSDLEALQARRQAQEAERQRREEEKRRAEQSPPMVAEPPAAYDGALFSNPDIRDETVRYSIVSAQHSVLADLKGRDARAFSRQILTKVKEVYGGNPVPFYTKAGLDKSTYSKIMSHPERKPAKETVLAMAAALQMTLTEAESFLRLAGYALSPSMETDIVWRNCFVHGVHSLPEVRSLLTQFVPPSRLS